VTIKTYNVSKVDIIHTISHIITHTHIYTHFYIHICAVYTLAFT